MQLLVFILLLAATRMKTITDNFYRIVRKQKELDYYFLTILRKPASLSDIQQTERELELNFNDELKELYLFADGIELDEETPCGKTGLMPIHTFLSLKWAIKYYQSFDEFDDFFFNLNTGYKPENKLFPVLEDGAGNCYWVDLNEGSNNYGRIFWTNTFGLNPDYTFESLTVLFQVIGDCYEQGIYFVDEEGYLNCDYNEFYRLCREYNPAINHWEDYK